MHGGIGMTDEYDIGLYMKRDRVLNELFGDPNYHAGEVRQLPAVRPRDHRRRTRRAGRQPAGGRRLRSLLRTTLASRSRFVSGAA
jgi:hypothetical protein